VNYPEQLRMGAFYANEFLDFHIKDRIVWLNPFEPYSPLQRSQRMHGGGWVRLRIRHFLSYDMPRKGGTFKGVPVNVRFRGKSDALISRGHCIMSSPERRGAHVGWAPRWAWCASVLNHLQTSVRSCLFNEKP